MVLSHQKFILILFCILNGDACTASNCLERVFSNMELHIHSIGESFCNSTQKRTASGKPDTVTHEICVNFRLHSLQDFHDTVLYLSYGLVYAARYVLIGYRSLNRMRCGHIVALHKHRLRCFIFGKIHED